MTFESTFASKFDELDAAHRDALAYIDEAVRQLRLRQSDLRAVTATEKAKQAADCIRRAQELVGRRQ